MLVKLLPEQAAHHWNDIKHAIEESLPPTVGMQSDRMQNILKSILTEDVVVWISAEVRDDSNVITGIVLTSFTFDNISGTKALLIYCVYGYQEGLAASWSEGLDTLKKFAKVNKCHRILGYTDVTSIIKFATRVGADTRYTLVSFDVD